jgi:hypothetical protein
MGKRAIVFLMGIFMIGILSGCSIMKGENAKVRDLDFTVLGEEKVPEALKTIIDERKADPFKFTYSDKEYLYICIGYGEQLTGGYSIAVNELYLGDNAIYVSTSLLGPDAATRSNSTPSYPYIVIKTEYLEETVIFQ